MGQNNSIIIPGLEKALTDNKTEAVISYSQVNQEDSDYTGMVGIFGILFVLILLAILFWNIWLGYQKEKDRKEFELKKKNDIILNDKIDDLIKIQKELVENLKK